MTKINNDDLTHILNHVDFSELKDKNIFITGGTGFLGKWMLESLIYANDRLGLNCNVTVLTRNSELFCSLYPDLAYSDCVRLCKGDVRYFNYLNIKYSHIIHMASDSMSNPVDTFDVIVNGTKRVLDLARDCSSKVVVFSSGAVYTGITPYAESKRVAEYWCSLYHSEYGLDVKIARGFCFVGAYLPLNTNFAIGNFINNVLKGENILIKSDGSAVRSYLYTADATIWFWNILFKGDKIPYDVGSEKSITIKELAELVASFNNSKVEVLSGQSKGEKVYVPPIKMRTKTELGLDEYISLSKAIKRTIEWNRGLNVHA